MKNANQKQRNIKQTALFLSPNNEMINFVNKKRQACFAIFEENSAQKLKSQTHQPTKTKILHQVPFLIGHTNLQIPCLQTVAEVDHKDKPR